MSRLSRRTRALGLVVASIFAMIAFASACSNNGEGERCQADNNNDDCLDGLQCIRKDQLVSPYNGADRCCPVNRETTATTQACKPGTGRVGNENPGEGGTDGAADTGTDARDSGPDVADTGTDAADDAPDGD